MEVKKILVTGSAGFIGFHLVSRLLKEDFIIFGLDNIDSYYDINLKYARLSEHGIERKSVEETENSVIQSLIFHNYYFVKADLANHDYVVQFMMENKFNYVVNLAAQAGVRYSLENPRAYTHSNIDGFLSILEGCRAINVEHLIFASTSSVYGLNKQMPLSEDQKTDEPMALYAATKKANELMAHSYSHLFQFPSTGLRFFTVYGPWGRPDMALFLFADAIKNDKPINVFNHGQMIRDFTYVVDIVESIYRLIPKASPKNINNVPFQVFNIGNNNPVQLMAYIKVLESELGKEAIKNYLDMQPGDVPATHADVDNLMRYVDFRPQTTIVEGVKRFVDWYKTR
jgi:UDP-glucuronate 4-epimerase